VADEPAPAEPHVADVVAAASSALGERLSEPVTLAGGSDQSVVLRCRTADGGQVIVKSYPRTARAAVGFASEAAGLEVAAGTGLSPDFLAASEDARVVVMSDLGSGPSLADVLLTEPGDTAEPAADAAGSALLGWAGACGRLSAGGAARRVRFDSLRSRYLGGLPAARRGTGLADHVLRVEERARLLGVPVPAGLDAELTEVARVADGDGPYPVFSPGDICPDNNVLTDAGVRLLDFEDAGFHSVFLDAAYIRMPFSTCWCVFRMPDPLAAAVESAYRSEVCAVWPELADDSVWHPGVRRAVAAWTMSSMWWLLRLSLSGDPPLDEERTSPRARQLMRHRWRVLADQLEPTGDLPVLSGFARSLLAATESWHAAPLPRYPALR
jgi:Ser/Thr protein kinase RdoA (MazF antagonist)